MNCHQALKKYFGFDEFREGQKELVEGILAGRDVLGVLPTGTGKSICYQVPAMILDGLTIVISPLISLMQDQVASLRQVGIPSACINSGMDHFEMAMVYDMLSSGELKVLYIAPERLELEGFSQLIKSCSVSLIAVDEAHCISQWGQDFRPSYLKISAFINMLENRPIVAAFTATATKQVQDDIIKLLSLNEALTVVTGFDRPNLYFDVRRPRDKKSELLSFIKKHKDLSGIVYCSTRAAVEEVCRMLCAKGFGAVMYHAGLSYEKRQTAQEEFQYDRKQIMVATNAFGMGIDKSNVSYVVHYNMPKSIEAYYQEAGRAGRDGLPAECILLFSEGDVRTAAYLIENGENSGELSAKEYKRVKMLDHYRLDCMVAYCRSTSCYRNAILAYFGQIKTEKCGNCGNCNVEYKEEDITTDAQKILSCMYRIKSFLGYYTGANMVAKVLTGSEDKKLLEKKLNTIRTYGIMDNVPVKKITDEIYFLKQKGYVFDNPEIRTIEPSVSAKEILFDGKTLTMPVRNIISRVNIKHDSSPLMTALKQERMRLAKLASVPAYVIFGDAVLVDMASKMPRDMDEMLTVSGIGPVKAEKYGRQFLKILDQFR